MRAFALMVLVAGDVAVAPGGVLPRGAQLTARMNTTIGTTSSLGVDRIADETRAGAPFAATVETSVLDERGHVRLPPGAVVHGHVARLSRGEGIHRAQVELAVDRLDARPIRARVVRSEVQQLPASDTGSAVDDTAFWGTVFGGIAFGLPGLAVGYAAGGSVGAVNATRARRTEAWLSAGSLITIELDAPLDLGGRCLASADRVAC